MRRIVVLGCGFGGLGAARHIERALAGRRRVQLTVVSDRSHFLYTPLLPNAAAGEVELSAITFPIRGEFDGGTEVLLDRAQGIDLDACVVVGERDRIGYDYLLVAPGAVVDWQGHPEWAESALTCKDARDATKIRERVAGALTAAAGARRHADRQRALTFVFAGGGPTGVELAAELCSTLRDHVLAEASDAFRRALRFVLVEPQERLLPELDERLGDYARRALQSMGVEVRLGTSVVGRDAHQVELSGGERIDADHLVWCAGVRAPALIADSGFELDATGRALVDGALHVPGQSGVYVVGDAAAPPGGAPQTAQVATQQADRAARNLVADLSGRSRRPWRYDHRGDLITLGRADAAAQVADTFVDGRAARALYRVVYAALMPKGLKKAELLRSWVVDGFRASGRGRLPAQWQLPELSSPDERSLLDE